MRQWFATFRNRSEGYSSITPCRVNDFAHLGRGMCSVTAREVAKVLTLSGCERRDRARRRAGRVARTSPNDCEHYGHREGGVVPERRPVPPTMCTATRHAPRALVLRRPFVSCFLHDLATFPQKRRHIQIVLLEIGGHASAHYVARKRVRLKLG